MTKTALQSLDIRRIFGLLLGFFIVSIPMAQGISLEQIDRKKTLLPTRKSPLALNSQLIGVVVFVNGHKNKKRMQILLTSSKN